MANTTKITNKELLNKLKASYLEQDQKDELVELIPYMSETDQSQLLSLIAESHKVKTQEDRANAEMQPALIELNEEYDQKMNQLGKELNSKVRKDYEGLERGKEEKELEEIEAGFKTM